MEIVLKANKRWVSIPWKEIWEYKDLVLFLVRRDFVARYKQTILGPLWYLITPIITSLIFTVVFGNIAKISTDGIPPMLFYLSGMLIWTYFSSSVTSVSSTFIANAGLFGKVYFPRFIIPLANVCSNLIAFFLQCVTFFAFWIYFKFFTDAGSGLSIGIEALLVLLILVQVAMLSLGIGLWFSAVSAKYRDLQHVTSLIIQLWLYATPIIYPFSLLEGKAGFWLNFNPMTFPVEATKYFLLGQGTVTAEGACISFAITLFVFFTGMMIFTKVERTFIDTV